MSRSANSFQSSVGTFHFDLVIGATKKPCRLIVDQDGEPPWSARFESWEEAKHALCERRTGFTPWDGLPASAVAAELGDAERWHASAALREI